MFLLSRLRFVFGAIRMNYGRVVTCLAQQSTSTLTCLYQVLYRPFSSLEPLKNRQKGIFTSTTNTKTATNLDLCIFHHLAFQVC